MMQPAEVVEWLAALFPPLPDDEARLALTLYRRLAQGRPVASQTLTAATELPVERIEALLEEWPGVFRDERGAVVGFWGLSLPPMAHRFCIHGRMLYTWCAWDALFLPELLGAGTEVESPSGLDRRPVRLHVTPDSTQSGTPEPVHVSFRPPDDGLWTQNIVTSFCHHVFFLLGDEAARWSALHPDGITLTLSEAFTAGRRKNARQFRGLLRESASA